MRSAVLTASLLFVSAVSLNAKEVKIHGYVTNLISPTQFEIEDYRITRDLSLVLELEKEDADVETQFRPEDIRVGTELEIKGDYDEKTGELRARSIKVFLEDSKRIKRTALIERQPSLRRTADGWEGTFFADGQNIQVVPATKVFFKPNKSESKALKERAKKEKQAATKSQLSTQSSGAKSDDELHLLESLDQITPGIFMAYEGQREPDGSVAATRLEFVRNELEKGEDKLRKELEPKVKEGDFLKEKPGELKIRKVGKFKLLANPEVQAYVQRIGERLVPQYQRDLAGDPNKIHFRFYVIDAKHANAFALANGVVVIHSSMFEIFENEAQLAAVLGHEIAHSVEEHTWRQLQYHKKKLFALRMGGAFAAGMGAYGVSDIVNLIEGAVRNGYSRSLENQADREGLQNMFEAGYDPREAPRVWKLMTKHYGDHPTNFFWSSHDSNTLRRSYLMAELRNNYASADLTTLRKDGDEFTKIAAAVREAATGKKKIKVKY